MYMVVANLLQKRKTYISVAKGGYKSLLEYLTDVGIDLSEWIVGSGRQQGHFLIYFSFLTSMLILEFNTTSFLRTVQLLGTLPILY